jgi:hypothetical protein
MKKRPQMQAQLVISTNQVRGFVLARQGIRIFYSDAARGEEHRAYVRFPSLGPLHPDEQTLF